MHAGGGYGTYVMLVAALLGTTTSVTVAGYRGGSGTAGNPYRIATVEDLIWLGEHPGDYDKHFILTADIDLDPNLPGGRVFDKAVVAPRTGADLDQPISFTGVFDGNECTIRHLTILGTEYLGLFGQLRRAQIKAVTLEDVLVIGSGSSVGALAGYNDGGQVANCHCQGTIRGAAFVGGLVGYNTGTLDNCSTAGSVRGNERVGGLAGVSEENVTGCYSVAGVVGHVVVGGLMGSNEKRVYNCYARGTVQGIRLPNEEGPIQKSLCIGGLLGMNLRSVTCCYSCGQVTGDLRVGGLIGGLGPGVVTRSYWDIETSGQTESAGGRGRSTAVMQSVSTYLNAHWDFVVEEENGTKDVWWILHGQDYPHLAWEFWASAHDPSSGAMNVRQPVVLRWHGGKTAAGHDVYFGGDPDAVAEATPQELDLYGGRQAAERTSYDPGPLAYGTVYYWRIDEINEAHFASPWRGEVVAFKTAACIVSPNPWHMATWVPRDVILHWVPGSPGLLYDVYFGESEEAVADATPESAEVYGGRYPSDVTSYDPGPLSWGRRYYWRVDAVDEDDVGVRWKGPVWYFTTVRLFAGHYPSNGATDVSLTPVLTWVPEESGLQFDVYFGIDANAVAQATPQSIGIYQARVSDETCRYTPGQLVYDQTYYWRIDAVDPAYPDSLQKGNVWSFTVSSFITVDDFESYSDEEGHFVWETWIDGYEDPTNGSIVGYLYGWWEPAIVHGGQQSMPYYYDNSDTAVYSEATARITDLAVGSDWTTDDADVLELWFFGDENNAPELMYVTLTDADGRGGTVYHDDPNAVLPRMWAAWNIPLVEFGDRGVDLTDIDTISLGFGNRNEPLRGAGCVYFDDIRLHCTEPPIFETPPF